jgi:hypothetical protein
MVWLPIVANSHVTVNSHCSLALAATVMWYSIHVIGYLLKFNSVAWQMVLCHFGMHAAGVPSTMSTSSTQPESSTCVHISPNVA